MEEEGVRMEWAIVMVTGGHLSVCWIWSAGHYMGDSHLLSVLPKLFFFHFPGASSGIHLAAFLLLLSPHFSFVVCARPPSACSSFPPLQLLNWLTPTDWLTLQIPSGLKLEILISKAHTISLISAALSVYISDNALTLSSQNLDFSSLIVHSLHFSLPSFAQLSPS